MQLLIPVDGYATDRSGHRLVQRMVIRWNQFGAVDVVLDCVVPEPVLARLEAVDDAMARTRRVVPGVLGRRGVATADVAATSAASEMEPPAAGCQALEAASATRRHGRIDFGVVWHRGPFSVDYRRSADQRVRRSVKGVRREEVSRAKETGHSCFLHASDPYTGNHLRSCSGVVIPATTLQRHDIADPNEP
jgi:hypothetical protein